MKVQCRYRFSLAGNITWWTQSYQQTWTLLKGLLNGLGCPQTVPVHNDKSGGPHFEYRMSHSVVMYAEPGTCLRLLNLAQQSQFHFVGDFPSVTTWAAIFQSVLLPWLPARRLRLNPNALVLACVQTLCRSLDEVSAEITQTPAATKLGAKLRCLQISKQNHQISC